MIYCHIDSSKSVDSKQKGSNVFNNSDNIELEYTNLKLENIRLKRQISDMQAEMLRITVNKGFSEPGIHFHIDVVSYSCQDELNTITFP